MGLVAARSVLLQVGRGRIVPCPQHGCLLVAGNGAAALSPSDLSGRLVCYPNCKDRLLAVTQRLRASVVADFSMLLLFEVRAGSLALP